MGGQYTFCGNGPLSGRDPTGELSTPVKEAIRGGARGRLGRSIVHLAARNPLTATGLALGTAGAIAGTYIWIQATGGSSINEVAWGGNKAARLYDALAQARAAEAEQMRASGVLPAWMRLFEQQTGMLPDATAIQAYEAALALDPQRPDLAFNAARNSPTAKAKTKTSPEPKRKPCPAPSTDEDEEEEQEEEDRYIYRSLSAEDRARYDAGLGLVPEGTGTGRPEILRHIMNLDTGYISASMTETGAARFYTPGQGMVKIDVDQVKIVPNAQILQTLQRIGSPQDVEKARRAEEVLIKGGVPRTAMQLIHP
ncbi:MAG: hypothetical protein M9894_23940 [Planctomycetes bacterium]|nr:hypothetical protein [Planctomycetota bacterium]